MRRGNGYIFGFILVIAVVSALVLSVASQALKERQLLNVEADIKLNILIASGIMREGLCSCKGGDRKNLSYKDCCTIQCCYTNFIKSHVINYKGDIITSDAVPERISLEDQLGKKEEQRIYPVFVRKNKNEIVAYIIPVVGKGLWSTLYGYMALGKDLNTVKGITFYKHGETPGLGAEIEKEWFQNDFIGKKILDSKGNLVSVQVVKGKINKNTTDLIHKVDGISGATLTGNGVSKLIKSSLLLYEPYFTMLRKGGRK